jgi:beta-phosphoglucomutase-like phosphatase (HAD superfamily)
MSSKHFEPKGIVFDCDGTLADTMPLHWKVWKAITERHNLKLTEDRFYALGGVPSRDILKMLSEEQNVKVDHLAVALEKEEEFLTTLPHVAPIEIIVDVARANHGKIPMAVASGGNRNVIPIILKHLKINHLFDAVVTSEDVVNQKPAPDIFLEAARRIGVPPQFCRAYEDTDIGLQAIRSAGMDAVDVRPLRLTKQV